MKKLTELSPEEKRILAAEACEWKRGIQGFYCKEGCIADDGLSLHTEDELPDYGNDLNACAEAVEAMPYEEQEAWLDALARVVDPMHGYRMRLTAEIANATAAQRLDAFLLAKGLAE